MFGQVMPWCLNRLVYDVRGWNFRDFRGNQTHWLAAGPKVIDFSVLYLGTPSWFDLLTLCLHALAVTGWAPYHACARLWRQCLPLETSGSRIGG